MSDRSLTRYVRAIERRWMEFVERPGFLSSSDYDRITQWHERGIPVELILECLDAADERRRAGRGAKRPRGLSYLAGAVDESWSVILEGRVSQPVQEVAQDASPDSREPLEAWRRRAGEEPGASPLKALLDRLLADLEAGADAEQIDEALDVALSPAVPPELREAAEAEARSWLEGHRSKLSAQDFEKAVRRAATVRLRRRLQLPRLAP